MVNVFFFRPALELIKSCRISIDLEDPDISVQEDVRIGMNVTDDFKTESFIVFKVYELSCETLPQVFLQSVVLLKIWNNWTLIAILKYFLRRHWCTVNVMNSQYFFYR